MGQWKHRLSEKNEQARKAVCSNCGEVKIKKQGKTWRCNEGAKEYRRYNGYGKVKYKDGRVNPRVCDLCSNTIRVAYDHNHKTGEFRGWLCINCNTALGLVHDSIEHLEKLIAYLKK